MAASMLDVEAGACSAQADLKLLAHTSTSINVKHAIFFIVASSAAVRTRFRHAQARGDADRSANPTGWQANAGCVGAHQLPRDDGTELPGACTDADSAECGDHPG